MLRRLKYENIMNSLLIIQILFKQLMLVAGKNKFDSV